MRDGESGFITQRKEATIFRIIPVSRIVILLLLISSIAYAVPSSFFSSSASPPNTAFTYIPKFVLIGDSVNFTEQVTGGTPPYRWFGWNFGDGSPSINTTATFLFHSFTNPGAYTVTMNVTDSASQFNSTSTIVTVNEWPVSSATAFGWVVPWNLTGTDGVNIHDVTYHGGLVISEARLAAVQVLYLNNFCGPFYDETGNMTGVKADGNISYYQNFTNSVNPYFQLTAEYRVGGYDYDESFRFYKDGAWELALEIGRGGCTTVKIYEPHWRIDLALNEQANNYMSMYTPQGTWQDLLWEGNHTDTGYRDIAHNSTIWRWGDQGRYYYIAPKEVRYDLDFPDLPSDIILARNHPNEIDASHGEHLESPTVWVNGEFAFRRDIVLWWVPKLYDHGPVSGLTLTHKVLSLVFYPGES